MRADSRWRDVLCCPACHGALVGDVASTAGAFGYQWKCSNERIRDPRFCAHEVLLDFVEPVAPVWFRDKPVIAGYIRGDAYRDWFDTAGLTDIGVTMRFGSGWKGFGRLP